MNMKKIIPLSFAALSVAGTLSACSDSSVSGADVQGNSIALSSSSVINPGSSSSSISIMNIEGILRAISRPNIAAAVVVSNEEVVEDTVNARETFENLIQSIIDADDYITSIVDSADWRQFNDMNFNDKKIGAMQDENGVVHGPIDYSSLVAFYEANNDYAFGKNISCRGKNVESPYEYNSGVHKKYWGMNIRSQDSVVLEQFRQDCAHENGSVWEDSSRTIYNHGTPDEIIEYTTRINCSVEKAEGDSLVVGRNPYWKKYATIIVEKCVAPLGDGE